MHNENIAEGLKQLVETRLLVTGASGLVGANLIRGLLAQGRAVRAMVHEDQRAFDGLGVEIINADVRDLDAVQKAMAGIDVVYHLAGAISLEMDTGTEMMAVNAQGTGNVVTSCLKCGVRLLVHFSSIDALRHGEPNKLVDESQPLVDAGIAEKEMGTIPPYDLSKAQGEREVLAGIAQGLDAVILRPTAMLGPNDFKPSYAGQALLKLAEGRIPALVSGGFDWVDVRDVVAGAMRAEQVGTPGSYYILGGHYHTIREVAKMAVSFSRRRPPLITIPMWLAGLFAPLMQGVARFNGSHPIYTQVTLTVLRSKQQVSSARAQHELGYSARPLSDTVRDTLSWFRDHGYLRG